MRRVSILILTILVATASTHQINVPAQLSMSHDYVYQYVYSSVHVISPREIRARYSIIIRNLQVKGLNSSALGLDSRLVSPGYTFSITGVYDSAGDLVYELNRGDEESPTLKVVFRRSMALGESYGFTYEYTVKWDYDSYEWAVSWSTSRVIEKIRLRISVSGPLRITRTTPAGAYSDDKKSAETQAVNVQRSSLIARFPPTTGKCSILALPVEFPDVKHHTKREEISRRVFQELRSYYKEASYNQLAVEGYVADWIELPKSASSYGISNWGSPSEKRRVFERDVIQLADSVVDFSRYDVVVILAAGRATVWAYSTTPMIRTNDGVTVERITVQTEYTAWGTFAHELGHQLGLPDLYDYAIAAGLGVYVEAAIYVGPYGLMSRSTERPNMLGWCKMTLGWIPFSGIQTVRPGEVKSIKIHSLESLSNETMVVKIQIDSKQYYVVEVRERIGYDSVLPNSGVLVSYVDELVASGDGPVRLVDGDPATKTLDDAPFDVGPGKNPIFKDVERGAGLVVLQKAEDGYLVHLTKADCVEEAREYALEAAARIKQAETKTAEARREGRMEGLSDALKELERARNSLSQADYRQAIVFATNAFSLAQKSTQLTVSTESAVSAAPMGVAPMVMVASVVTILTATAVMVVLRKRRGMKKA